MVFSCRNSVSFQQTAQQYEVRAMPTFVFFKNGQKVGVIQGANIGGVEAMIKQHATGPEAVESKDGMVKM